MQKNARYCTAMLLISLSLCGLLFSTSCKHFGSSQSPTIEEQRNVNAEGYVEMTYSEPESTTYIPPQTSTQPYVEQTPIQPQPYVEQAPTQSQPYVEQTTTTTQHAGQQVVVIEQPAGQQLVVTPPPAGQQLVVTQSSSGQQLVVTQTPVAPQHTVTTQSQVVTTTQTASATPQTTSATTTSSSRYLTSHNYRIVLGEFKNLDKLNLVYKIVQTFEQEGAISIMTVNRPSQNDIIIQTSRSKNISDLADDLENACRRSGIVLAFQVHPMEIIVTEE